MPTIEGAELIIPKESLEIKDTIIVLVRNELVMLNFGRSSGWYVGDILNNIEIPQFSSFTKVDKEIHGQDLFDCYHGFVTGGRMIYGFGTTSALGVKFV